MCPNMSKRCNQGERMKVNILITGVGGQGILLASNVLGKAAIYSNYNVVGVETHGMAQRGGSVVSHIRIGEVYSPLIPEGEADFLLAFEPLEALRQINFLNEESTVILNSRPIYPPSLKGEIWKYPKIEKITKALEFCNIISLDATDLAKKAGNIRTLNVVMLGVLSSCKNFPLPEESLKKAITETVPKKTIDINLKAFHLGKNHTYTL